MTSQKQLEANRQNALRSTGPRTADGRAAVSQNAVRHGLRAQRVVIEGEPVCLPLAVDVDMISGQGPLEADS